MPEIISQADWDGVYYDGQSGVYFILTVHEDGISMCDPFTGDPFHHMTGAEFEDESDEFLEIDAETVRNPESVISDVVIAAQSAMDGDTTEVRAYHGIEVEFALQAVDISARDAAYRDRLDIN
jgi:hypothetical protein